MTHFIIVKPLLISIQTCQKNRVGDSNFIQIGYQSQHGNNHHLKLVRRLKIEDAF